MNTENQIAIGDVVEWRNFSGKAGMLNFRGVVVAMVPVGIPGEDLAKTLKSQGYKPFNRGNPWLPRDVRSSVSYIVAVGKRLYWPRKFVLVKRSNGIPTVTGVVRWIVDQVTGREVKAA